MDTAVDTGIGEAEELDVDAPGEDVAEEDFEARFEAEDGVVEVMRVMDQLDFPWAVLPPGPRRWAPSDLSVEGVGDRLQMVRMIYRTVGDRAVVVAGTRSDADTDELAKQLSTPLLFAHYRRLNNGVSPAVMSVMESVPVWETVRGDGWEFGQCGVGSRPARLARRRYEGGHVVVSSHGVASEEMTTLIAGLVDLHGGEGDRAVAEELAVRHRRALAQRWWDAPRTPWQPAD